MGYQLRNRIEVSIFINNVEYPLESRNVLNFLHMGTSVRGKLPTVHFNITDVTKAFNIIDLQDGIPIRIAITTNKSTTRTYLFRKFNHVTQFNGASYVYDIDGYWDAPLYWGGTANLGIQGTSDEVLAQIAGICGLKYEGVSTNDNQLWMQQNMSYSAFAKQIRQHGYKGDTSCMMHAVDLDGMLLYKDINKAPDNPVSIIMNQDVDYAYNAIDYSPASTSGFTNKLTGYNHSRIVQTIDKPPVLVANLTMKSNSRSPQYNTTVKGLEKRGSYSYSPIGFSTVHEHYEEAQYQNIRYSNLYSMGVQILIGGPTSIRLMSDINFIAHDEKNAQSQVHSGLYKVSSHAIYITNSTYSEKFEMDRHGTNANYVTG